MNEQHFEPSEQLLDLYDDWRREYGEAVDSDATVSCSHCWTTLHGNDPAVEIVCWTCYSRWHYDENGETLCGVCASDHDCNGEPSYIDAEGYPDGLTCAECGRVSEQRDLLEWTPPPSE